MAEVIIAAEKLIELLNEIQDRIRAKPWKNMNIQGMIYNLAATINELEEAIQFLDTISREYEGEGLSDAPSLKEVKESCHELIVLLKRNKELEEGKINNIASEDIYELKKAVSEKEIYGSLEQQLLDLILKTRYAVDRVNIYEKKRKLKPIEGTSARKNVLDLLEHKEDELTSLKKKYEELRVKSHMGLIEETSVADLEKDYYSAVKKEETEFKLVLNQLNTFEKEIEAFQMKYLGMKNALMRLEELNNSQEEKAAEIIKYLKKEKDYARKLVLEIENETIRLRSAYSKELLSLEEGKEIAKHEAYEKFKQQLLKFRKENDEKMLVINDLRKIIKSKEDKIKLLSKKLYDFEKEKAVGVIKETKKALELEKKKHTKEKTEKERPLKKEKKAIKKPKSLKRRKK